MAIAVLSFSLGHLVTRESAPTPEEAARLENPALPESEVLEEMNRLEQRLKVGGEKSNKTESKKKKNPVEKKTTAAIEKEAAMPASQSDGTPIKVKTIETIVRLVQKPIEKAVNIKAYKPITRTGPIIAASEEPAAPVAPVAPAEPDATDGITVVEAVREPSIAPLAAEPEQKKPDRQLAEIKLKERPTVIGVPKFAVQVGSFPSEAKAMVLMRKLKGKGYNSYLTKAVRTRAIWYRVRVGAYADRWMAEKGAGDLRKREGLEGIIVAYEKP